MKRIVLAVVVVLFFVVASAQEEVKVELLHSFTGTMAISEITF